MTQEPEDNASAQAEVQRRQEPLLQTAQNALSLVVGLGAVFTAIGFVIVNLHLSRYTEMQWGNINSTQYLLAGAVMFVILLLVFLIAGFGLWLVTSVLFLVNGFAPPFYLLRLGFATALYDYRFRPVLVLMMIAASYAFGSEIYGALPRYLGGGAPIPVYLVLKDAQDIQRFGFEAFPGHTTVSYQVKLLTELSDGLLVFNDQHADAAYAVAVKQDAIQVIIDAQGAVRLLLATAEVTPEPTEAPTAEATVAP
jgi:hypothetical protein